MLRLLTFAALSLAFFGTGQGVVLIDIESPAWGTFIQNLIGQFQGQARVNQFGFIVLGRVSDGVPLEFQPDPHDSQGRALVNRNNPVSPADPSQFRNYVAAGIHINDMTGETSHSETLMLNNLEALLNNYMRHYSRQPDFILLYTYYYPCTWCANNIGQYAQDPRFSRYTWILSFTNYGYDIGATDQRIAVSRSYLLYPHIQAVFHVPDEVSEPVRGYQNWGRTSGQGTEQAVGMSRPGTSSFGTGTSRRRTRTNPQRTSGLGTGTSPSRSRSPWSRRGSTSG